MIKSIVAAAVTVGLAGSAYAHSGLYFDESEWAAAAGVYSVGDGYRQQEGSDQVYYFGDGSRATLLNIGSDYGEEDHFTWVVAAKNFGFYANFTSPDEPWSPWHNGGPARSTEIDFRGKQYVIADDASPQFFGWVGGNGATLHMTFRGWEIASLTGGFYSFHSTPGVPEPTSWAMMMAGFGLIGGATRYRRNRPAEGPSWDA